jgi:RNA polymerase sigma-70 factor (ECF subfamily)
VDRHIRASRGDASSTVASPALDVAGLAVLRAALAAMARVPAGSSVPGTGLALRTGTDRSKSSSGGAAPRSPRGQRDSGSHDGVDDESRRIIALVELAQNGDGEAFGQLYDTYVDTVYRYIYYRVSSRTLAEDLTSETFLRALRRVSTFTWQGRDFGAWLVTIARNLVADHFKSGRHRMEITTGEMLDSDETEESPETTVVAVLANQTLLAAVEQLNPQQQECVKLRFLQGLSVAETARIMGKNDGAVKTLQYRAVRTLARLLPDEFR